MKGELAAFANEEEGWASGTLTPQSGGTYTMTGIPFSPAISSVYATAMNSLGDVAGFTSEPIAFAPYISFVLKAGASSFTPLPSNGYQYVRACAINDSGAIVGDRQNIGGPVQAFLYKDGITYSLNSLLDPAAGWNITSAAGINNAGQIAATGFNSAGQGHAVLLNGNIPFGLAGATANASLATGSSFAPLAGTKNVGSVLSLADFSLSGSFATLTQAYDPAEVLALGADELSLRLYWYDTANSAWILAGNTANNTQNPAAQFVLGAPTSNLGDWGLDLTNHLVWANIDHASSYGSLAAVPEPSTLLLLASSALLLIRKRR